jgi:single stranded DNA-binding protein
MSVNKVILVGRLGKDPETRFTSGGQAVCNFSMATDETFKDRNGERQKRTEWHRIVLWGKRRPFTCDKDLQTASKGRPSELWRDRQEGSAAT